MLWPVTGMLIMSSVALEWAKVAERREDFDVVRISLMAAGLFTLAFVSGQLLVLRQLTQSGFLLASNPANSFFFLIVGLHGIHVLGGVIALGKTIDSAWRDQHRDGLSLSISLCATYWHFSVSHLACFARSADRVGRRLRRHLSAVVNLRVSSMLQHTLVEPGERGRRPPVGRASQPTYRRIRGPSRTSLGAKP